MKQLFKAVNKYDNCEAIQIKQFLFHSEEEICSLLLQTLDSPAIHRLLNMTSLMRNLI